jgi:hypothetical protein
MLVIETPNPQKGLSLNILSMIAIRERFPSTEYKVRMTNYWSHSVRSRIVKFLLVVSWLEGFNKVPTYIIWMPNLSVSSMVFLIGRKSRKILYSSSSKAAFQKFNSLQKSIYI